MDQRAIPPGIAAHAPWLAGAQRQPYRQTIAIDHRMNFARQAAA
jgi:hypothetical protein